MSDCHRGKLLFKVIFSHLNEFVTIVENGQTILFSTLRDVIDRLDPEPEDLYGVLQAFYDDDQKLLNELLQIDLGALKTFCENEKYMKSARMDAFYRTLETY